MNNFGRELYESFRRSHGWTLAVLSLVAGLVAWNWKSDVKISLFWVFVVGLAFLTLTVPVIDLAVRAVRSSRRMPVVKQACLEQEGEGTVILVLEHAEFFAHGSLVSIYQQDTDYERLIGWGSVHNIQMNGLVQILVSRPATPAYEDRWEKIRNNDQTVLKSLLVKPSVPEYAIRTA